MANTKKEWANMSPFEKGMQFFVNAIVLAIGALLPIFMYLVPVQCDNDGIGPWCWAHPGSVWDLVGLVLWIFGTFWLSGVWGYFVADDDEDPWKTVTIAAWCCAVVGPFVIILF